MIVDMCVDKTINTEIGSKAYDNESKDGDMRGDSNMRYTHAHERRTLFRREPADTVYALSRRSTTQSLWRDALKQRPKDFGFYLETR